MSIKKEIKLVAFLASFSLLGGILLSCDNNKLEIIENTDIRTLPSMTIKGYVTIYNDSGKLNMEMSAPLMEQYSEADPSYTEFKEGLEFVYYDNKDEPATTVSAKYAKLIDSKNLWELRDSVVIYSDNGTKLETEQLFWEQSATVDRIYTDRFAKITDEDKIITVYGFESDSRLIKRKFKKITGEYYFTNEQ